MSDRERKDLTWTIWRVCERDGMTAALGLLELVGKCYGEREKEEMATAVSNYRCDEAAWR